MYMPINPYIHHLVSAYLCRYLSYIIDLSIYQSSICLSINHIASVIYLFIFIYGHEYKIVYIM